MKADTAGFSSRTGWSAHSNPISRLLEEKKRQKKEILDLTESNPTRCNFRFYGQEILSVLSDPKNLRYEPDPQGLLEAREAVCRYYAEKGVLLAPGQIFLTSGTTEAYGFLFRLLADAGDEFLAVEPGYPLFDTLAELNDVRLKKSPSAYREGWRLETGPFERMLGDRTKAALIVHPNNPTGHFITSEEKELLNAALSRRDCALIADEVFLDSDWGLQTPPASFAGQSDVLTFTLSGVSKILGLPQMKLSWIVVSGPEVLRQEALRRLELIADAYLSVNTPSQRALAAWMKERPAAAKEMNGRARGNFSYLEEKLRGLPGFQLLKAEGGWYAVLRGPSSFHDENFALELLEKKEVLVHPGFFFDFPGDSYLVLSLLPDEAVFREGLRRFCEVAAGLITK